MTLFVEILNAFSNAELSETLGIDESHARTMRTRKIIPVDHWPSIITAARSKGIDIDFDKLAQARKAKAAERAAKSAERRAA